MANTEGAGDDRPRPIEETPRHERVRTAALTSVTNADAQNDEGYDPDSIAAVASIAQAQALIYVGDQIGRLADVLSEPLRDAQGYGMTVADWLANLTNAMRDR